jgi:putative transposase
MGQVKSGELAHAARLGFQVCTVRDRGIDPDEVGGLLAVRPGWLFAERRLAQAGRAAKDRLRRELADALVTSMREAWLQEPKHTVSDVDAGAIDARWAAEVRRAKQEARQLAGELTPDRLRARIARERDTSYQAACYRAASSSGGIVVEGLDAAGMLRQKGLPGARARRRGLSDSALGEARRQLAYKTGWYGSRLIVADRWYPSSKTCHACGNVLDIGWHEHWTCAVCGAGHQRDDNAAINLARYEPPCAGVSAVGPVRAAVKRRADRKTGPRPAGGDEARKGPSRNAGEQPRDGVLAR